MNILRVIKLHEIKTRTFRCHLSQSNENNQINAIEMSFESYEGAQVCKSDDCPPLLVMHGILASKRNWNSLCNVFCNKTIPQRKIIAVDARNHGRSPHVDKHTYAHLVEDIKHLLNKLEIKKASLLGHSMGGLAVMYFALKYPEIVDNLLVADISPITTSPKVTSLPALMHALEQVTFPKNILSMAQARKICDKQLCETIRGRKLREFLLINLVQGPNGSYQWQINIPALLSHFSEHISRFPAVTGLTFKGPVIFIAGGDSDFVPKSDYPEILKIFPKAQLEYISDSGHSLYNDKPLEFSRICLDFLNKNTRN